MPLARDGGTLQTGLTWKQWLSVGPLPHYTQDPYIERYPRGYNSRASGPAASKWQLAHLNSIPLE